MRLRPATFTLTFALAILVVPIASAGQQAAGVHRVGILGAVDSPAWDAFRQGLRELGYVAGQNITLEYRWTGGKDERLPDLAAELVRLNVAVIVTSGMPAIQAVRKATATIPIVMAAVGDPVGTGLVASLARPGGNLTGLSLLDDELDAKRGAAHAVRVGDQPQDGQDARTRHSPGRLVPGGPGDSIKLQPLEEAGPWR